MKENEMDNPNIEKEKSLPSYHRGHLPPLSEDYPTFESCNDLLFFHKYNPFLDKISSLETLEDLLKVMIRKMDFIDVGWKINKTSWW